MAKNGFSLGFFASVVSIGLGFCMCETNSAHAFGRSRPTPTPTPTATTAPTYTYSAEELEGLRLVNEYRASIGLGQLTRNDFISFQCLDHNNYMILQGVPSHDGFVDRATAIQKNFNIQRVGEVVAYNFSTPQSVLNAWLNSPGHKAEIEGKYYKRVGYSLRLNSSGKKFYTMIFSE